MKFLVIPAMLFSDRANTAPLSDVQAVNPRTSMMSLVPVSGTALPFPVGRKATIPLFPAALVRPSNTSSVETRMPVPSSVPLFLEDPIRTFSSVVRTMAGVPLLDDVEISYLRTPFTTAATNVWLTTSF